MPKTVGCLHFRRRPTNREWHASNARPNRSVPATRSACARLPQLAMGDSYFQALLDVTEGEGIAEPLRRRFALTPAEYRRNPPSHINTTCSREAFMTHLTHLCRAVLAFAGLAYFAAASPAAGEVPDLTGVWTNYRNPNAAAPAR